MAIEIDYKEIEERLGITEEVRKRISENPPSYSIKTFYDMLENINPKNLPPHVQLSELMTENGIKEGHPMYNELIRDINLSVENALKKKRKRGWTHPSYTVPITMEEFIVDLCMTIEGMGEENKVIPDEYQHLKEKFRYN